MNFQKKERGRLASNPGGKFYLGAVSQAILPVIHSFLVLELT